jgi:hypothetical protein
MFRSLMIIAALTVSAAAQAQPVHQAKEVREDRREVAHDKREIAKDVQRTTGSCARTSASCTRIAMSCAGTSSAGPSESVLAGHEGRPGDRAPHRLSRRRLVLFRTLTRKRLGH